MPSLISYLPFSSTINTIHACTYLLAVCLFSITFLVFLNSVVSFVITDLIGIKDGVGDLVGTLGFVDELVAIFACPFWGVLSDRIGVRYVCVAGYSIIGVSLFIFVQARNVYPQLLLARALFSIGGAATATMVTGILPIMSGGDLQDQSQTVNDLVVQDVHPGRDIPQSSDSQVTVTPANYIENHMYKSYIKDQTKSDPSRLAGFVGLFTGCGALVALIIFLPLPARLSKLNGINPAHAVIDSFYVVGTISIAVACACFLGLRNLVGEEGKDLHSLFQSPRSKVATISSQDIEEASKISTPDIPYWRLLLDSAALGITDYQIGLAYIGGFVARASSVGITLFIPTYVNAYFLQHGFCDISPNDPSSELKNECRAAYLLASELTGISQFIALLFAPIFGYLSQRYKRFNIPTLIASISGIIGYLGFANLASPETKNIDGRGGSPKVFLIVSLIGISQIGAIVCSLGLLGQAILYREHVDATQSLNTQQNQSHANRAESIPLLPSLSGDKASRSRVHLKGSIAGIYSLFGGAAILILTKLGGYLFDTLSTSSPFYIMATFNGLWMIAAVVIGIFRELKMRAEGVEIIT
ncbi:putative major facilitator superfamily transporter [Erysiphe neolycopersici]|uniref:Putative major facilitator superfamily transporter n=1 Tax=Erysiphe neolycopersici TaxID=212602 RepID=A0A420I2N6_9PEZI|nr:putative major facilitator superfamily transporter [Erysiphe neolycopersici]